jgi:hypothetical protein
MAPAERQFLARVEQGQLAAIVKLGFQYSCIDAFGLVARHVLGPSHRTTATAFLDGPTSWYQAALIFDRWI